MTYSDINKYTTAVNDIGVKAQSHIHLFKNKELKLLNWNGHLIWHLCNEKMHKQDTKYPKNFSKNDHRSY